MMTRRLVFSSAGAALFQRAFAAVTVPAIRWKTGDRSRPLPPQVTPGTTSTPERAGTAPSDAVALFAGKDLSAWQHGQGKPAQWKVSDGHFEVAPKTGDLITKQAFGDGQLHVEWASPDPPQGMDQEPGNSGIYIMSLYEIQVLESYRNKTYADGQAAAIYCQYPPLVNASLPPGHWQTYDIVFHGARFGGDGSLLRAATVTVLHNGVLVQDHVTPTGPTDYMKRPPYKPHAEKLPLLLQDLGQPVRYRNIWIRELGDGQV
ncbi:MAG: DUF1080 domain-containing protein [Acidobacteriota bacterium]|nr:DUF1080 domain-containing protein [Acidobacteriota bacterium]